MKKIIITSTLLLFCVLVSNAQNHDPKFKRNIKFGGRIMFDYGANTQQNKHTSGSEFRRVRSFISGKVAKNVAYKLQLEFSNGKTVLKDAYIKLLNLPKIGGNLTVGNFIIPTGLNTLTSSKYISFIERATLTNYHASRSTGFMYNKNIFKKSIGFQIAYNTNSNSSGLDTKLNEGQNLTFRLSGLVLNDKDKHQVLHLGAKFENRKPSKNNSGIRTYKLGIRPESHLASKVISNTFNNVNHINISGLEFAYTHGSFSLQSEYTSAKINTQAKNYTVPSYYAFVSYFLTKEYRPYKSYLNGFARVKPHHNFNNNSGWGALELAIRFSSFDLSDANQGKLNDLTFGLNWYLNPYTRVMYNFVSGNNSLSNSKITAHLIRFQIDF